MAGELNKIIEFYSDPWRWGKRDCGLTACQAFEIYHGVQLNIPISGEYSTRREFLELLKAHGGMEALAENLAELNGLISGIGVSGEIGIIETRRRLVLGFCHSPGFWLVKSKRGFKTFPSALRSWTWQKHY